MKNVIRSVIAVTVFVIFCTSVVKAQTDGAETKKTSYKLGTDFVSSYVWRGIVADPSPSIQPYLAFVSGGFEAGVMGSANFRGSYKEVDTYIAYSIKSLRLTLTDYNWLFSSAGFFNYNNEETDHILEGSVAYTLPEGFPLTVSLNTMFYGADKLYKLENGNLTARQNYSTYIELAYPVGKSNLFFGMTPSNGIYGAGYGKVDGFAVVNLGITTVKNLKITPDFELPLKGTICVNPQEETIHFVIGISL